MNKTLKTILSIAVIGVLLYFLVWPWINSAISSGYHIKAITEGYPSQSYTADFGTDELTVKVEHYNNVATDEKTSEETENYSLEIDEELYNKLKSVANSFLGFHLFVRHHNGYAFFYESTDGAAMFFTNEEKEDLLTYAKILTTISRGDEKWPEKRRETYYDHGVKELDEYIKEHEIEVPPLEK